MPSKTGVFDFSRKVDKKKKKGKDQNMSDMMDKARMHIRTSIVKAVMDGANEHVKVEELDGGMPAGVVATHRIVFNDHVVYCASEKDAKTAESAFLALVLTVAMKFADDLTGGKPENEPAGERVEHGKPGSGNRIQTEREPE